MIDNTDKHLFVDTFFSTPIFFGAVTDQGFHEQLIELFETSKKLGLFEQHTHTEHGKQYTKEQMTVDNDTTASTVSRQRNVDILHDHPEVKEVIYRHVKLYLQSIDHPPMYMNISASWMHHAKQNDTVGWHHHGYGQDRVCGVYYIKSPGVYHGGRTAFRSPNPYADSFPKRAHSSMQPVVDFEPIEKNILLWPSWLEHRTTPNYHGGDRVILSFNVDLTTANK